MTAHCSGWNALRPTWQLHWPESAACRLRNLIPHSPASKPAPAYSNMLDGVAPGHISMWWEIEPSMLLWTWRQHIINIAFFFLESERFSWNLLSSTSYKKTLEWTIACGISGPIYDLQTFKRIAYSSLESRWSTCDSSGVAKGGDNHLPSHQIRLLVCHWQLNERSFFVRINHSHLM